MSIRIIEKLRLNHANRTLTWTIENIPKWEYIERTSNILNEIHSYLVLIAQYPEMYRLPNSLSPIELL